MMMSESEFLNMLDEMMPSGREYPTQDENALVDQIRSDFTNMQQDMEDDMFLVRDIAEDKVIEWLKNNTPEFLVRALKTPDILSGSKELDEAMMALGYMKPWDDVDPDTLDPDDYDRWMDWDNRRQEAARHPE